MNEPTARTEGDQGDAWEALPAARQAEVRELFVLLAKALRAYQIYEENNPVYQRFVTGLRGAFQRIWAVEDHLTVTVEEARLLLEGSVVYANDSHGDSLAFLLYKDGVREATFLRGIEEDELERFLSVLHRARHAGSDVEDLLTLLWEEDFQSFRYEYIDYLAEDVVVPDPGPGASRGQVTSAWEQEAAAETGETRSGDARPAEPGPQHLDQDSLNPTLYALDPGEMARVEREVDQEMRRDLRADVLNALFDRLEEPARRERQSEILSILGSVMPNLLGRGALGAAGMVLTELRELQESPGLFDRKRQEEAAALLTEVSTPAVVEELVRALEDGSITPSPRELSHFLLTLRGEALEPLLRASETVSVRELQPALRSAVGGIASRNRRTLTGLLSSPDARVAAGAARLVGSLQVAEAAPALLDLLKHEEPAVRIAAIEAGAALRASMAAGALQDCLTDSNRAVRMAAARALGGLHYRPAAPRLRALLTGRAIRAADISEKIAFFEGYGELGDPDAVSLLDRLLNGKGGLLARREPSEIRAAAALALGKVGTHEARQVLEGARRDEDAVVRSAVSRALRGAATTEP